MSDPANRKAYEKRRTQPDALTFGRVRSYHYTARSRYRTEHSSFGSLNRTAVITDIPRSTHIRM